MYVDFSEQQVDVDYLYSYTSLIIPSSNLLPKREYYSEYMSRRRYFDTYKAAADINR